MLAAAAVRGLLFTLGSLSPSPSSSDCVAGAAKYNFYRKYEAIGSSQGPSADVLMSAVPGRFRANLHKQGGLQVAATVRLSSVPNAGLGVFVRDAQSKSTTLWKFNRSVGLIFGDSLPECVAMVDALGLTAAERHFVASHGYGFYVNDSLPPYWRLANDMADFVNNQCHGPQLTMEINPDEDMDESYAARHLPAGAELFETYVSINHRSPVGHPWAPCKPPTQSP